MKNEVRGIDASNAGYGTMMRKFNLYRIVTEELYDDDAKTVEEVVGECLAIFNPDSFAESSKYGRMLTKLGPPSSEEYNELTANLMALVSE